MRAIDDTDTKLLLALARSPRDTIVALATRLGMSRNTVQARLAGLEKRNVFLSFDRRIDPVAVGYPLTAFITIHVQQQKLDAIVRQIAQIPEIIQGHGLSGQADLMVRVVCLDADDLFRVTGTIRECDGVDRTETSLVMNELIPFRMQPLLERGRRSHPGDKHRGENQSEAAVERHDRAAIEHHDETAVEHHDKTVETQ